MSSPPARRRVSRWPSSPHLPRWPSGAGASASIESTIPVAASTPPPTAVAAAAGRPWAVLHGDLPLLQPSDFEGIAASAGSGTKVLAPSRDGGTNLIAGLGAFSFRYGPGSFARHMAKAPGSRVVVTTGLAVDIDTPADLTATLAHPEGAWLKRFLTSGK